MSSFTMETTLKNHSGVPDNCARFRFLVPSGNAMPTYSGKNGLFAPIYLPTI